MPKFKQYNVKRKQFDAYDKGTPIKAALGSERTQKTLEVGEIHSADWQPGASGWRLLANGGIEFGVVGSFPPGSITFTDIQNIATDKILGRDTAGSGSIEQLGLGAGLSISGGNLVNTITQYTDELAQDAIGNAVGSGLDYDDGSGAISVETATVPRITSGSGAPGTTPAFVGYIYIDTSGAKVYISTGTASSADWSILN